MGHRVSKMKVRHQTGFDHFRVFIAVFFPTCFTSVTELVTNCNAQTKSQVSDSVPSQALASLQRIFDHDWHLL